MSSSMSRSCGEPQRRKCRLTVVGGLVATGLALHKVNGGKTDTAAVRMWTAGTDRPTPSLEAEGGPLGQPAAVPSDSTRFTFLARQNDKQSPVAYDPCRPIHYVTNSRTMPPNGDKMVTDAIAAISAASGLVFINVVAASSAPPLELLRGWKEGRRGLRRVRRTARRGW